MMLHQNTISFSFHIKKLLILVALFLAAGKYVYADNTTENLTVKFVTQHDIKITNAKVISVSMICNPDNVYSPNLSTQTFDGKEIKLEFTGSFVDDKRGNCKDFITHENPYFVFRDMIVAFDFANKHYECKLAMNMGLSYSWPSRDVLKSESREITNCTSNGSSTGAFKFSVVHGSMGYIQIMSPPADAINLAVNTVNLPGPYNFDYITDVRLDDIKFSCGKNDYYAELSGSSTSPKIVVFGPYDSKDCKAGDHETYFTISTLKVSHGIFQDGKYKRHSCLINYYYDKVDMKDVPVEFGIGSSLGTSRFYAFYDDYLPLECSYNTTYTIDNESFLMDGNNISIITDVSI